MLLAEPAFAYCSLRDGKMGGAGATCTLIFPAVRNPGRQRNGNLERANGFNVSFWAVFRCPPANCHSCHTCQGTQLLGQTWPADWFCVALEAIHCLYSFKWLGKRKNTEQIIPCDMKMTCPCPSLPQSPATPAN